MKRLKTFIKKLQRSDDKVKRRWYTGGAVLSMAIVLVLWTFYLSKFVTQSQPEETTPSKETETSRAGAWETFKKGFEAIGEDTRARFKNPDNAFGGALGGIGGKINETRDILIETPESDFYFEGAEDIPTATIPLAPRKP